MQIIVRYWREKLFKGQNEPNKVFHLLVDPFVKSEMHCEVYCAPFCCD